MMTRAVTSPTPLYEKDADETDTCNRRLGLRAAIPARGASRRREMDPDHARGRRARHRRPACAATDPTGGTRRPSDRGEAARHLATHSQPGDVRRSVQRRAGRHDRPADLPGKYGWLGIDITGRLLEHATETAGGLSAENVDRPPAIIRSKSLSPTAPAEPARESCVCQSRSEGPPSTPSARSPPPGVPVLAVRAPPYIPIPCPVG